MSRPTTRAPGGGGSATLLGGRPVGMARRRVASVAEGVIGPDLPERVELVREAPTGPLRAGTGPGVGHGAINPGPAAARPRRRGLVSGGVRPPARW
jgi:hypothetical protein